MAANVFAAALRNSEAEGNDRNVLLALADCAWRDGVTWILVGDDKYDEDDTICRLARVSRATVWRSLTKLRERDEIQTVRVRRGRSFVTVYRVLHGAVDVDYERIPFELPYRFGEPEPVQRRNLQPSTSAGVGNECSDSAHETSDAQRCKLQRSTEAVECLTTTASTLQGEPVQRFNTPPFNVSLSRVREEKPRTVREPAAGTVRETTATSIERSAAASVTDREVTELVRALRGADAGSPARIIPLAQGFQRPEFLEIFETVCRRRANNPVGLLTHLLHIARAERTAVLSAQLHASLGTSGRAYVPAPWMIEVVRAEEPERYVRLMAARLTDGDLRESLRAHGDRVDVLLALAARVRAGDEAAAERDTPEQARARWVERHAVTDPAADVVSVIDAWDDVDPLERQALHERAEQIREHEAKRKAA